MDQQETFPQLVGILDTNDNWALASATTALSEAGIIFDVVAIDGVSASLEASEPKWRIRPSRILVAIEDAIEARALVEPFQMPLSASNNIEVHSPVKPGLIWRGVPDAPLAQRIGARLIGTFFVCVGLFILHESLNESPLLGVLFSAALVFVGVRVFFKGLAGSSR